MLTLVHVAWCAGPGTIRVPHLASKPLLSENGVQVDLRTGDYSVAVIDERGRAWLVAEYAGDVNATSFSPTNQKNRTLNWGTWLMQVGGIGPLPKQCPLALSCIVIVCLPSLQPCTKLCKGMRTAKRNGRRRRVKECSQQNATQRLGMAASSSWISSSQQQAQFNILFNCGLTEPQMSMSHDMQVDPVTP